MRIQLSDHFTYSRLFRFTLPSIIMMIVTSIYSVVDGIFVSNVVGDAALAAVNIVYPLPMVLGAFGFMLGTGGSAEVARVMGAGKPERAKEYFTTLIIAIIVGGAVLSALCIAFIRPLSVFLGADEALLSDCVAYGAIMSAGSVFFMLQTSFQSFCVAAEKPKMGLYLSLAAGGTNMALDYLFIAVLGWGVAGAALATVAGYMVGGLIPLVYFLLPNSSTLRLVKTHLYPKMLLKSSANGSSELLSNISFSLVSILFNVQLLRLAGDNGIIAYGIIMYMSNIFFNIFFGFSMGIAPVVGYHFGAENRDELKNLRKKCFVVIAVLGIALTGLSEALAIPFARIFATTEEVFLLTRNGVWLYSFAYLLMGVSVFGSAFFTALNNGLVSASISFIRSFVFQCGMILLMPVLLGMNGVWLSAVFADIFACAVTVAFFLAMRKKYGY